MANFTSEDVDYLRHGDRKIMARIFKPEGAGPFPCFINLHGGAWNNGDLADSTGLGEYLASRGVVMPTLNFRHGPDGYPTTLADINYGIRWVKAHANELKIDPNRVAIGGQSSGGHLAMLVAMRPKDPRYAAIPCQGCDDPSVRGVFMQWPVINPLSRYKHAKRLVAAGDPPAWAVGMDKKHETYWHTEAEMAEGNPILLLERGEKVVMPTAVWLQGRAGPHPTITTTPIRTSPATSRSGLSAITARRAATSRSPISTMPRGTPMSPTRRCTPSCRST